MPISTNMMNMNRQSHRHKIAESNRNAKSNRKINKIPQQKKTRLGLHTHDNTQKVVAKRNSIPDTSYFIVSARRVRVTANTSNGSAPPVLRLIVVLRFGMSTWFFGLSFFYNRLEPSIHRGIREINK